MSALEIWLGGVPTNQLPNNVLPTLRDVLIFYSSFWKKEGSDSLKEQRVAQELKKVYEEANIPTVSDLTIKNRVKKTVSELKKILKFQQKVKTADNIRRENDFISRLGDIFEIRPTIDTGRYSLGSGSASTRSQDNNQNFSDGTSK